VAAFQELFVGPGVDRAGSGQSRLFLWRELDANLVRDCARDVALECQDIAEIGLVLLAPQVRVGCGVNQLCRDANTAM
jgi:hypothetical protein